MIFLVFLSAVFAQNTNVTLSTSTASQSSLASSTAFASTTTSDSTTTISTSTLETSVVTPLPPTETTQESNPSFIPSFLTPTSNPTESAQPSTSSSSMSPVLVAGLIIICLVIIILVCFYIFKTASFIERNRKTGKQDNNVNFTDALEESTNHSTSNRLNRYPLFSDALPTQQYYSPPVKETVVSTTYFTPEGAVREGSSEFYVQEPSHVSYAGMSDDLPTNYYDEEGNPIYYYDGSGHPYTTEDYLQYYSEPTAEENNHLIDEVASPASDQPLVVEVHPYS